MGLLSPELQAVDPGEWCVLTLVSYFTDAITLPHTFDELRALPFGRVLTPLIIYLSDSVHHPAIVSALLYVHIS